jgi:acetylornithine deacetylase/succinyl-diaminopimelate desuccinylase-like protein
MDINRLNSFAGSLWEQSVLPALERYIAIPAKSPAFDSDWQAHGQIDGALALIEGWCRENAPPRASVRVERLPGKTPLLLIDVPGRGEERVLLYGHFDKQPEMNGWREGLGPWSPVREGDRLYGRGGADDGYSTFAAVVALRLLEDQGVPHAPCTILIEGSEESGSIDLPDYLEAVAGDIGRPGLIVCLDSGCGNYDQLWVTTSLRGIAGGVLRVSLLSEGVHSGDGSGVVADSFRVARRLLDRVVLEPEFQVQVPPERVEQAERLAAILGEQTYARFPLLPGAGPVTAEPRELILNRTWRPALAVTGAAGLPPVENAGNVLRPATALKLSLRLPPTCDAEVACRRLKEILEEDPPYGARVEFEADSPAAGWNAPATAPWLRDAIDAASRASFGREAAFMGEGGSIPFMAMLGRRYPEAQFLITGVLGPGANAHGPNEFLHVPTAQRLTAAVAQVIAAHAGH